MKKFQAKKIGNFNSSYKISDEMSEKIYVIPSQRVRYLSEIAENNRAYDKWVLDQKEIAQKLYVLDESIKILDDGLENTKKRAINDI
jgi:methylmalonyl-CoA mutase